MGNTTASGEPYDFLAYTCAHKTLPFGTVLELSHGQFEAACVVTDRGPFVPGRDLDVSLAVAVQLDMLQQGVVAVHVKVRP